MSVLGELHACGTWLAQFYPWGDAQAAWFLLTGNFPHVAPLELGMRARSHSDLQRYQITLTVEPWVSAETVLRAYRAVQGLVLDGRDNRPLRERSLALARFMASQRVAQGKRPPWKRLTDAWNRSYPQWYYSQVSNFAKDVDRAELALRFPKCDVPWGVQRWSGFTWHPSLRYVLGGPGDDPVEPQPASALEARCQELVAKQFDQGITSAEHAELRTLYQQRAARQQNLRLRGHKRPSDPSTRR